MVLTILHLILAPDTPSMAKLNMLTAVSTRAQLTCRDEGNSLRGMQVPGGLLQSVSPKDPSVMGPDGHDQRRLCARLATSSHGMQVRVPAR